MPGAWYDDELWMRFGENWEVPDFRIDSQTGWGYIVRCAWLLMQQSVTSTTTTFADRASVRRLQRRGHDPAPVRVIALRHASSDCATGGDREYHHRWVVRGHWRRQWYPRQERNVPIWISPHVKGPEDAPLLGGEKVYAWRR